MKLEAAIESSFVMNYTVKKVAKTVILITLTTLAFLLTVLPIYNYPLLKYPCIVEISSESTREKLIKAADGEDRCDIFTGQWVPNPDAPYYTNTTCWAIHDQHNCMKFGKPDDGFMKWRWKPNGCDLPIFNPYQFLDIVRDKSMAFVGDSVGRNHMRSLICLLSRVEFPIGISDAEDDYFRRWKYTSYNFTLAAFWTPLLVKFEKAGGADVNDKLYLDEYDEKWTTQIEIFDYIILNAGPWFFRPSFYYESHRLVGCHSCGLGNVTHLPAAFGYRRALRTALRAIKSLEKYKGTTFLRTYAPSHFENGNWNNGGNCLRKRPFRSNQTTLEANDLKLYLTQVEEFRLVEREGKKQGFKKKFRLLDITQAMLLRPDGHPGRYGHRPQDNVRLYNDCLHWCLPGPIDSWSDLLLHMLKMEGRTSH